MAFLSENKVCPSAEHAEHSEMKPQNRISMTFKVYIRQVKATNKLSQIPGIVGFTEGTRVTLIGRTLFHGTLRFPLITNTTQ